MNKIPGLEETSWSFLLLGSRGRDTTVVIRRLHVARGTVLYFTCSDCLADQAIDR